MTPRRLLLLLLLPAVLLPAAPEPGPRIDRYGDPLPDGAIARLGTLRFRGPGAGGWLAYSPDGKRLASSGIPAITIWEAGTGRSLARLGRSQAGQRYRLAFSPDGQLLASASPLCLQPATGGDPIPLPIGPALKAQCVGVAFTPQGHLVVVGTRRVVVIDRTGRQVLRSFDLPGEGKGPEPAAAVLSPDGTQLAIRIASRKDAHPLSFSVWDLATGEELLRLDLPVAEFAYTPDGETLAVLADRDVLLLDPLTGRCRQQWRVQEEGPLPSRMFAFSPDGKWLAAGNFLFDVATGEVLRSLGESEQAAFSPDRRHLALAGDGFIAIQEALTGRDVFPWEGQVPHRPTRRIHPLPSGQTVVTFTDERDVRRWDPRTGEPRGDFEAGPVSAVAGPFATTSRPAAKQVHLLDLRTGRTVRTLDDLPSARMALSADGRLLFAALLPDYHRVQVWDFTTGKRLSELDCGKDVAEALTLSPAGDRAAVFTRSGAVRLVDPLTGRVTHELVKPTGRTGDAERLEFSPDGHYLVLGRRIATTAGLSLWETTTGRLVRECAWNAPPLDPEEAGRPFDLSVSPDGRLIATTGPDAMLRVWETATLRERFRHAGTTAVLAFIDPSLLATGDGRPDVLIRDLNLLATPVQGDNPQAAWTALGDDDAKRAHGAIRALAGDADRTVALLRERLRPVPALDRARVRDWIAQLDADEFEVRQAAARELAAVLEQAGALLVEARRNPRSAEQGQRLDELLSPDRPLPEERRRTLRAIETLETIATPAARTILERLSTGEPAALETQHAAAALERLRGKP